MTSMMNRSDAEWWDDFNRADEDASRRRHPAGRARTPMDTAQDFHDDVQLIDEQTGRVLPRQILPPAEVPEAPASILSLPARIALWALALAASVVYGVAVFAVFYGWEGPF